MSESSGNRPCNDEKSKKICGLRLHMWYVNCFCHFTRNNPRSTSRFYQQLIHIVGLGNWSLLPFEIRNSWEQASNNFDKMYGLVKAWNKTPNILTPDLTAMDKLQAILLDALKSNADFARQFANIDQIKNGISDDNLLSTFLARLGDNDFITKVANRDQIKNRISDDNLPSAVFVKLGDNDFTTKVANNEQIKNRISDDNLLSTFLARLGDNEGDNDFAKKVADSKQITSKLIQAYGKTQLSVFCSIILSDNNQLPSFRDSFRELSVYKKIAVFKFFYDELANAAKDDANLKRMIPLLSDPEPSERD